MFFCNKEQVMRKNKMNIKICDFDFLIKEEYIKKENVHDTSFAIKYILLFTKSQNWET
jgi:hypothetical protein